MPVLIRHLRQLKTVVFPALVSNTHCSIYAFQNLPVVDDDAGAVPHVEEALVVEAGDGGIVGAGIDEPVRRVGRADADGIELFSSHSPTVGQKKLDCFQALIFEIGTRGCIFSHV